MRTRSLWMPLLAAGALLGSGDFSRAGAHPQGGRPECPHDWDFKQGEVPFFEPIISVPEFHDCQRFIVPSPDGLVYDSLFAIFASPRLGRLDSALSKADSVKPDSAILAAFVYAEGRYPSLGIKPMFNCLYLWHRDKPGVWGAAMVPIAGNSPRDCPVATNAQMLTSVEGRQLEVRLDPQAKGAYDADIPAVARWDWDSVHTRQYIGLKCGGAWCEVGDSGFVPSGPAWPTTAALGLTGLATARLRRTMVVKGWYDQQFLATLKDRKPWPSSIRGTIYPDATLDERTQVSKFPLGSWVPVARVALEVPRGVANPYKKSLNLDPTPKPVRSNAPTDGLNTMLLCRGSRTDCWRDASRDARMVLATCDGEGMWWMKIRAVDQTEVARCVVRRGHENLSISALLRGTVRWRWLASDETVWDACAQGCCETEVPCWTC